MVKMPRFRPAMSEMLINIWFECVPFHRFSSPFFRLGWGSATLLATEKRLHSTGHVGTNHSSQTSKEICLFQKSFFFRRMQIAPTPSVAKLAADASCHQRRIKITQGCFYWTKCLLPIVLLPSGASKKNRRRVSSEIHGQPKCEKRAQVKEEVERKQAAF